MTWPKFISQGQCMHMFSNNKANICFTSTFSDFVPGVIDWASTMSLGGRWGFWIFFPFKRVKNHPSNKGPKGPNIRDLWKKNMIFIFFLNQTSWVIKKHLKWNPHPTKKWGGKMTMTRCCLNLVCFDGSLGIRLSWKQILVTSRSNTNTMVFRYTPWNWHSP